MNQTTSYRCYAFIHRHFALLFWPVFFAAFVVAFIQLRHKTYLTGDKSPQGIVSLELGWSAARDSAIVRSWETDSRAPFASTGCSEMPARVDRTRIARNDIYLDFLFILLYTGLGIIILAALQTRIGKAATRFSNSLLLLALSAAIADCIENLGMLAILSNTAGFYAHLTTIAAWIKFGILIFLLLYLLYTLVWKDWALQNLSRYIRDKSAQLFRYRVILIGLLVFSLPIWVMDQGQDLLINSNSRDWGIALFLAVVMTTALLNWYLSKLFFEDGRMTTKTPIFPVIEPQPADPATQGSEKKASRFLGILSILIPSVAVLNAMRAIRVPFPLDFFPPLIWLVVLSGLFFVLVRYDLGLTGYEWLEARKGRRTAINITLMIMVSLSLAIPSMIRWLLLGGISNTPASLFFLFCHLLLLTCAFYIFVSVRTRIFPAESWMGRKIGWPVIISGGFLALAFIALNCFPHIFFLLDRPYLSLPVLLSGITFYTIVLTLLIRVSLRMKINFVLFLFIAGLLISITASNDYHAVARQKTTRVAPQLGLNEYFRQWLLFRKHEIASSAGPDSTYPVFIVNTYGGGIRAAAFTNMVISWLDSLMIRDTKDRKGFEHYVFSISGASGGTIGAAVQCAYRARFPDRDEMGRVNADQYALDTFYRFYQHDFLTPVLCNMLGRDIWASASSLRPWQDRSAVQEKLWSDFGSGILGIHTDDEFNTIWDTAAGNRARYEVPLLFSNTLNVDDGLKGIMAPVQLDHGDFPSTIFIRERIDALNHIPGKDGDSLQSISLMTGAFLSARFPYISPGGKMGPGFHFMDGGAKDNSGAFTSESIFISLAKYANSRNLVPGDSVFNMLMRRVRFYFVSITNNPYFDPDSNRHLVANRFEPLSPLIGIINSGITGNARAADSTLRFRYAQDSSRFLRIGSDYCSIWPTATCIRDDKGNSYSPVLPLGWQISTPSLTRLRYSFADSMIYSYDPPGIRKILAIVKNKLSRQ